MKDKLTMTKFFFIKPTMLTIIFLLFCNSIANSKTTPKNGKIFINIYYEGSTVRDTLSISIGDNMLAALARDSDGDRGRTFKAIRNNKGYFGFEIPIFHSFGYFNLTKGRVLGKTADSDEVAIMDPQFWESGDSLTVHLKFTESISGGVANCKYSGRGSLKYNLVNDFNHFKMNPGQPIRVREIWPEGWDGNILEYDKFDSIATVTVAKLKLLDDYKNKLTAESYNILKADLIYSSKSGLFGTISHFKLDGKLDKLDAKSKNAYMKRFNSSFDFPNNYGIDEKYLANSINYLYFLFQKIQTASKLSIGEESPDWVYSAIKNYAVNNEIKEVLIMRELTSSWVYAKNLNLYYEDAKTIVKNTEYLKLLNELQIRTPGRSFTDFALEDVNGRIKILKDYDKKVLLLDFWYTGCGHCSDYYVDVLSKVEEKFKDNPNVLFLSISVDRDKLLWKDSINKGKYTSKMVENLYTNGLASNDPIIKLNNIPGYPFIILLDKDHKIKFFNSINLHREVELINSIKELL